MEMNDDQTSNFAKVFFFKFLFLFFSIILHWFQVYRMVIRLSKKFLFLKCLFLSRFKVTNLDKAVPSQCHFLLPRGNFCQPPLADDLSVYLHALNNNPLFLSSCCLGFFNFVWFWIWVCFVMFFSSRSYLLAPPGEDKAASLCPTPRPGSHSSTLPLLRPQSLSEDKCYSDSPSPTNLSPPSHRPTALNFSVSQVSLQPRTPLPTAWWDDRKEN